MITSNNLLFSNAQALTVSAASTNSIDLGATGTPYGYTNPMVRDLGRDDMHAEIYVDTTGLVGLTSLQVSVQTSPDNATWTTVESGRIIPAASLGGAYQFSVPNRIPQGTNQRYIQLYYTIVGTATAGTVTAGLAASRQTNLGIEAA